MIRFAPALISILLALNARSAVVDVQPQTGRALPPINWTDETGRSRNLSEFYGYPLLLLPIYTRCPGPCLQNVDRLKSALANSTSNPRQFRVLLFSFDATDTPASLAKYRDREHIPLAWLIGRASQPDIDLLLNSVGVQVGRAGTEFEHPNVLLFVDPNLRIAKWIYGTRYSGGDVDRAIRIAAGESDWIGQHAQLIYSLLLFGGSVLCVTLCHHVARMNWLRRASTAQARPTC